MGEWCSVGHLGGLLAGRMGWPGEGARFPSCLVMSVKVVYEGGAIPA